MIRFCLRPCLLLASLLTIAASARGDEPSTLTFERDVRPILKAYCLDCHGAGETLKGGLDLRLKRFAERGGESGPALTSGQPDESLILERMQAGEMPPGEKKVPAEQIAIVERWIAGGAKTLRAEPDSLPSGVDITPEERAFWAFQPLRRPTPPIFGDGVGDANRIRTPIDAFLLAKLRERDPKTTFARDADRLTLIRRASADLTGLPPSRAEIAEFSDDPFPDAYERMIDRLLASPRYGERWARHWLDAAGYADSDGNGGDDSLRPYSYKYRDYVIRSFNADKRLDQFLIEQLAGDELVPRPWTNLTPEQVETLAATGFLRMVSDGTTTGAPDEPAAANQVVADSLKVVGSSLLGLTVGCAQCHDHRYDPIPQSDYFRLRAIFEPALDPQHWRRPSQRLVSLQTDADRTKAAAIEAEAASLQKELDAKTAKFVAVALKKELAKFPEDQRARLQAALDAPADKRTAEQKALLAAHPNVNLSPGVLYQYDQAAADELKKDAEKIAAKRSQKPVEDFVSVLDEVLGVAPETRLFHRGDHRQPTKPVGPGDLTIAAPDGKRWDAPADDPALPTSGRRLAYARYLTNGKHPLLGRALANRIWQHHFGRGIVETPGDFGVLGQKPTHPELLDWLADELARQGWGLKRMHRLIMTSTAYRQSSSPTSAPLASTADTDDALYGRYPLRRLDAEALRDRVLAVSGKLDLTPFGPAVPVVEDAVGQAQPANDSARRSIYLQVRRTKPISFLAAFDAPLMAVNCDRRVTSASAPQSLMLMNSDFILNQAKAMAARVSAEAPDGFAGPLAASASDQPRLARPSAAWRFGYGEFDEASGRTASFVALSHWTGSAWQGGPALPDPAVGWAFLRAGGGHAGNDLKRSPIRRWTAPAAGIVTIVGKLKHEGAGGDGVRARIVSSRDGLRGEWKALRSEPATDAAGIAVQAGDTLDFLVDCIGDVNCDSFEWSPKLTMTHPSANGERIGTWDASSDFQGPPTQPPVAALPHRIAYAWTLAYQRPITAEEMSAACEFVGSWLDRLAHAGASTNASAIAIAIANESERELTALAHLCQQLLSSNEFLYVD